MGVRNRSGRHAGIVDVDAADDMVAQQIHRVLDKDDLTKELGDVLWYLSAVANDLGIDLQSVAERNIKKLKSRQERGVLGGSGDNR